MPARALQDLLLNRYQRGFPLEPRPFARVARELDADERKVIEAIRDLQARGAVVRLGAVVRPNTIGASTLAAVSAPEERLEAVAAAISARPEVNHCYEREHAINLWFVVTARDREAVAAVLKDIEDETGLAVLDLPMVEEFYIDLGFDLQCR